MGFSSSGGGKIMALNCRQCGVIGSVVDTICRNCGTVLTNGAMPVINNPGSIAFNNNPNPSQQQPLHPNSYPSNNQYNFQPKNSGWQSPQNSNYQNSNYSNNNNQNNNYQNPYYQTNNQPYQNQPPSWQDMSSYQQGYQNQPNQTQSHTQYPYPPNYQPQHPQMQMQRWTNPQANWGQPQNQQVFIVNGVHPTNLYQERKSPALSVLLSFLLTGAGQFYNGQAGKGLLMLGSCIILWGFFLGWVVSLWSIYDAYNTSKKINSGQQVT
jgi:TM2 domain-containing membrane protein YozV